MHCSKPVRHINLFYDRPGLAQLQYLDDSYQAEKVPSTAAAHFLHRGNPSRPESTLFLNLVLFRLGIRLTNRISGPIDVQILLGT